MSPIKLSNFCECGHGMHVQPATIFHQQTPNGPFARSTHHTRFSSVVTCETPRNSANLARKQELLVQYKVANTQYYSNLINLDVFYMVLIF